MNTPFRSVLALLAIGVVLSVSPDAAYAYGGPGSVISGIGTLLAALFGFVWFPLKRLYARLTEDATDEEEAA
ncbi:MAG: hypothetical protein BRD39_00215 [Bacteroidetes bacterium QH_9_64_21]|nr:MAG: hypothetical protein BRD39_00215 [Bacteroidetes bacterium QH_9_64_21]